MNASIQIVCKQLTIRFVFNKLNENRIIFLRIFATRNFSKDLFLRIVFCFKCDYARNLSFRTLCFSSSVFPPQREYITLLAKSLQAPREYLFCDATAKRRNKRDEHPTICLGETLLSTMRPLIVSRRNVLLVSTSSLHHQILYASFYRLSVTWAVTFVLVLWESILLSIFSIRMTGIDRAIVASNIPEESSFFSGITEAILK